jgi:hypothetical protein
MSITTLKKRLTLGRPLLPSEHESNFADIEAFVNALEGIIGTSLNPDGTLKDGALSGAAQVADSILTLAKLAITTNANAVLGSDASKVISEITGSNGEYLRKNATTGELEFGTLPAAATNNTLIGVYTGGTSVLVPNISEDVRFVVIASALIRGRVWDHTFTAELPIEIDSVEYSTLDFWASAENDAWIGSWATAQTVSATYTQLADVGTTNVAFGTLVATEATVLPSNPDSLSLSDQSLTVLVFGNN